MTDEAKNQVYQILVEECPPGGSIPMTRVGEILREGGVTPQSLGYGKLKKMLEDMPDVVKLSSKTTESGLGQVWYATLQPRKSKKKKNKAPAPVQAPAPAESPAPAQAPASAEAPAAAETPAPAEAPAPAETPAPVEAVEELPATMDRDEIFFPVAAQKHVSAFLLNQPEAALSRELLEEIRRTTWPAAAGTAWCRTPPTTPTASRWSGGTPRAIWCGSTSPAAPGRTARPGM